MNIFSRWKNSAGISAVTGKVFKFLAISAVISAFGWFIFGNACMMRSTPKGRQISAKIALVDIYSLQIRHKDAHGRFSGDMQSFPGFVGGNLYSFTVFDCDSEVTKESAPVYAPQLKGNLELELAVKKFFASRSRENACEPGDKFAALAVGMINSKYQPVRLDVWKITEKKQLKNIEVGI